MKVFPPIALLSLFLAADLPAAPGDLDPSFNLYPNGDIKALTVASDGKIMVGGAFTVFGATGKPQVARLLSTGQVDSTFSPPTAGATVQSLARA